MINLENLELVLFDFDDTLCLHTNHKYSEDIELNHSVKTIKGENPWTEHESNIHLKKFMELCSSKNIRMGLMSSCLLYPDMKLKEDWIEKEYGFKLENYCVAPGEKINTMIAISKAFMIKRENILIIDDYYATIETAANNGFQSASPMEVVNLIERMKK